MSGGVGGGAGGIYGNLRGLVSVVDELRDVGLQHYINLPRICAVGTQSSGKSSVLESIVGLDFLPRGEGVVTRRPLELRLVHLSDSSADSWAVFDVERDKKYHDFEKVREKICSLTDEVAGLRKGIINDPITLTVYSPNCPDLTLIDLPGITRVPLQNSDQTEDIERVTREMAMHYARDPRTIILAVIAANVDISTSDALQMARQVDTSGIRTIGVITKIDLMDRGTDAARMLRGEDIPLRLGYTGIKNRSQADIKEGKSIQKCIEDEKNFFHTNPLYSKLPQSMLGIPALTEKLTKILFRHIKWFLPEIKREINTKLRDVNDRLTELGEGVPLESTGRTQLLWAMVTDYCDVFKSTIRGKYDKRLQALQQHQPISGGAQIRQLFNELLDDFCDCNITADMDDYDIDSAVRLHEGDSLPGFPSPDTFEYLILPHLRKLSPPCLECLDRSAQVLENLAQKIAARVCVRFPRLAERVLELSQIILQREKAIAKIVLENFLISETSYLFTNDESYLSSHGALLDRKKPQNEDLFYANGQKVQTGRDGEILPQQSAGQKAGLAISSVKNTVTSLISDTVGGESRRKTRYSVQFIAEIRQRLESYFTIVLRNIRDCVPKFIGHFLVRSMQDKLQFELYTELNDEKLFLELLGEPEAIRQERATLKQQTAVLQNSLSVMQKDPHIIDSLTNDETMDENFDAEIKSLKFPPSNHIQTQNKLTSTTSTATHSARNFDPGHTDKDPPPPPISIKKNENATEDLKSSLRRKKNVSNPLFDD